MVIIVGCPSCRSRVIATEDIDGKCKGCGREYYWGSPMEYDEDSFMSGYGLVWLDKVHPEGWDPIDYIEESAELYPSDFKYSVNDLDRPTIMEIPPLALISVNMRNSFITSRYFSKV